MVWLPTFFISALCGSERSASCPNHLTSLEIIPRTYVIGGSMVRRREKSPAPLKIKPRFPGHPACTLVNVLSSKYWTVFRQELFLTKNHNLLKK